MAFLGMKIIKSYLNIIVKFSQTFTDETVPGGKKKLFLFFISYCKVTAHLIT